VAEELVRTRRAEVRFVGSSYGIEARAVPRAGFPLDLLPVRGVRREGIHGIARALWQVPFGVASAWRILRRFRPHLAVGIGGYASFPAVTAAIASRVPVVLLEQNASPGLVTRLLAPFAKKICVSFAETERELGGRAVMTGNPVRARLAARAADEPVSGAMQGSTGGRLRILVFGGSAGAHRLNAVVPSAISRLGRPVEVVHQTGERDREEVTEAYRSRGIAASVQPFIDDMAAEYQRADLAICRAGATTIAELTAFGVPAILVPYPFAAGDHQRRNAAALVDAGAAWMMLDADLGEERLADLIRTAADDPVALDEMRARARSLGHPDAAARVVAECLGILSAAELKSETAER
jgi:UDP-N-acetylglucosamine--N-acetylmuramyl-(pentapeptide) pyrophosphoryl-undecaprenol N-acetylglucosamine transferase